MRTLIGRCWVLLGIVVSGTVGFPVVAFGGEELSITCPDDVTAECTGPDGAIVSYGAPTVTSTCSTLQGGPVMVDCTPPSGSLFPLGSTPVTCTARDQCGNQESCVFTVTVQDTTPPTITCPANITIECTSPAGATVSYPAPTSVTDRCSPVSTVTCTPASGSTFPRGATTVTCTVSDTAAPPNTATCTFSVTVEDTRPPIIECPDPITAACSGDVEGTIVEFQPMVTDTCDDNASYLCVPPSLSHFPTGVTTVTCTASDASGNSAACSFRVTILGSTSSSLSTTVVGQPASALVFPLFDSTAHRGTILTVTNTDTDRHLCVNGFREGDVKLVYTY
ncbi:MAG: HYR domain-containing protein, partial [Planctomycetes bacterium]|nr:HYR domain-containing protein [Planctomycetota bacterium]